VAWSRHRDSFSRLRGKVATKPTEGGSSTRLAPNAITPNKKGTRTEVRMPLGVDYGLTGFNWVRMYFEFDQLLTMLA